MIDENNKICIHDSDDGIKRMDDLIKPDSVGFIRVKPLGSITLKNLVERLVRDRQFLKNYPDQKEMLEKRISHHTEMIIQLLEDNKDNPYLDMIRMK